MRGRRVKLFFSKRRRKEKGGRRKEIGWIWTACRVQLLPNGGSVAALNRIGSNEVNTDNSPISR